MKTQEFVEVEIHDGVATVTLRRPPVNALTAPMMREIAGVFTGLGRGRDAHVAILTAAGDRVFCAGADLAESERRHVRRDLLPEESVADLVDAGAVVRECFWSIYDCPLPVIAAVNGAAVGAGAALVACCDMILAAESASFGLPEINVGVLGGARHLQRMVGVFKTRAMFFTGRRVPAAELYRLGAIEQVVPLDGLLPAARALAGEIATKSPLALRMAKQAMNRVEALPLKDGYQLEQDYTTRVARLTDSVEARRSYQERRPPTWTWT